MNGDVGLQVLLMEVGPLAENAYVVLHQATGKALVVDPGDEGEEILRVLKKRGATLDKILLTHGHFDHVGAVKFLKDKTGAQVCIHREDAGLMQSAGRQGLMFGMRIGTPPPPDVLVEEGTLVPFADGSFRVIHTPGHTPGGVTYVRDKMAFVGDLIFAGSIGRTDLPGGAHDVLLAAVREKIFTLPGDTVLFPGHGPSTTVGEEMRSNPFFTGVW